MFYRYVPSIRETEDTEYTKTPGANPLGEVNDSDSEQIAGDEVQVIDKESGSGVRKTTILYLLILAAVIVIGSLIIRNPIQETELFPDEPTLSPSMNSPPRDITITASYERLISPPDHSTLRPSVNSPPTDTTSPYSESPITIQGIPFTIHYTNKEPAEDFESKWADGEDHINVKYWDDEAAETLVKTKFSEHYELWKSLQVNVEKWDWFRYMMIHEHGGYYFDDDIFPQPNSYNALFNASQTCPHDLHIFVGPKSTQYFGGVGLHLCQDMFGARAGHPFLRNMIDQIPWNIVHIKLEKYQRIFHRTGPFYFSKSFVYWLNGTQGRDFKTSHCIQSYNERYTGSALVQSSHQWKRYISRKMYGSWIKQAKKILKQYPYGLEQEMFEKYNATAQRIMHLQL